MSEPLKPDQRFLDRMYGIHSPFEYKRLESLYGPDVQFWTGGMRNKHQWEEQTESLSRAIEQRHAMQRAAGPGKTEIQLPQIPDPIVYHLPHAGTIEKHKSILSSLSAETPQTPSFPSLRCDECGEPYTIYHACKKKFEMPKYVPTSNYIPFVSSQSAKELDSPVSDMLANLSLARNMRRNCTACHGTGEAPGITCLLKDRCWRCDGLGYITG